ncbi:hypothetical protein K6U51_12895 [Vibrio fluvialis]|uniref:hypothetical protein n=2 Tax=Vibrio fluvialis TaxID=676 RepID=UPI001EEB3B06|nr:hypothetical protein [Vibrio fluvialis]MCG6389443.1 hypothetical protein [Vibrio fluvialis]MCG6418924.1 hypothetical protein [Vibrio fluvialis]
MVAIIPIISVVVGILLGAVISFISFQYKERKSSRERLNKSLFNLLSVWFSVVANSAIYSDLIKDAVVSALKRKFPNEKIPDNFPEDLAKGMRGMLPVVNHDELYKKYHTSVESLADIDPLLAFQLSSNKHLVDYLKKLHERSALEENNEISDIFLDSFTSFAYKESMHEFEKDLIKLSRLLGKKQEQEVKSRIERAKQRMAKVSDADMDELVNQVFDPALKRIADSTKVA